MLLKIKVNLETIKNALHSLTVEELGVFLIDSGETALYKVFDKDRTNHEIINEIQKRIINNVNSYGAMFNYLRNYIIVKFQTKLAFFGHNAGIAGDGVNWMYITIGPDADECKAPKEIPDAIKTQDVSKAQECTTQEFNELISLKQKHPEYDDATLYKLIKKSTLN